VKTNPSPNLSLAKTLQGSRSLLCRPAACQLVAYRFGYSPADVNLLRHQFTNGKIDSYIFVTVKAARKSVFNEEQLIL